MSEVRYLCIPEGMTPLGALRSGEPTFDTIEDAMIYLSQLRKWSKASISKAQIETVAQYSFNDDHWEETDGS